MREQIICTSRHIIRARDVITPGRNVPRGRRKEDRASLFGAVILQENASRRKCAT